MLRALSQKKNPDLDADLKDWCKKTGQREKDVRRRLPDIYNSLSAPFHGHHGILQLDLSHKSPNPTDLTALLAVLSWAKRPENGLFPVRCKVTVLVQKYIGRVASQENSNESAPQRTFRGLNCKGFIRKGPTLPEQFRFHTYFMYTPETLCDTTRFAGQRTARSARQVQLFGFVDWQPKSAI
jgi:hypothetical protein